MSKKNRKVIMRKITTQIGSLPFDDISEAVEYSLMHDIPFLPELPLLGETMLEYIKNPGRLKAAEEFKKKVREKKIETVKMQCVGPVTLIQAGYEENDAVARIFEHVSCIKDGLHAKNIILFLDEPALGYTGIDYERLWLPIFASFDVAAGVHVCGNMNWDLLLTSDLIDIISFDASRYDITIYPSYKDARSKKTKKGKIIAWGAERFEDIKDFKEGDMITLPCGIGSKKYTREDAYDLAEAIKQMSYKF